MNSPSISLAQPGDTDAVRAIAKQGRLSLDPTEEAKRDFSHLFVARNDEERVLGFVLLWIVAGDAEVIDIAVQKDVQGQGIGRALLAYALDFAFYGQACQRIFLEVRRSNTFAILLYQKLGFLEVGRRKQYYADGEDALLFSANHPTSGSSPHRI